MSARRRWRTREYVRRICLAVVLATAAEASAGDSAGYRGPDRNGVFVETGLMPEWPAGGPPLVWRYGSLGNSWGAVTVSGDRLYVPGGGSAGRMYCFSLEGRLLWCRPYGPEWSVRYVGSRSTPTAVGKRLVHASGVGTIYCLDAADGEVLWSVDTVERFDNKVPGWGYNISPLVVDGKVLCPIRRGSCTVAALDLGTGETVWANEPSTYAIGDSSPILVDCENTRLAVMNLWNALIALDPDTGEIVWKLEGKDRAGTSLTPVFAEGYLLVMYANRLTVFRQAEDGRGFEQLWRGPGCDAIAQAVILDGKVFAFGTTRLAGPDGEGGKKPVPALVCYDADTGEKLNAVPCTGGGSVVAADGMLYWQESGPRITLARPTAEGLEVVSRFRPDVGATTDVWIHPVIAHGRLFVRSDCAQGGDYLKAAGKLAVYDLLSERAELVTARRQRVARLAEQLGAGAPDERLAAAKELRTLGWKARPAAGALVKALRDEQQAVREQAAGALVEIGPAAVPELVGALVDESMWTNELARRTLVRAAPDAEDMTTALLDVAASSPVLREDVATLLARVGPEAAPAVTERLVGAPKRFRWWCIEVLKGYGPGAACAVDELIHVAETQDQWFRALAAKALGEIGPEAAPAASALLKLLEHSYADARAAAARALGKIGRRDERILDALRAATGDKEQKVAEAAAWALEALGG